MFQMTANPPNDREQRHDPDHKVEAMKQSLETLVLVPLFSKFLPDVSQSQTPRQGSSERVKDEASQVHARNASRKRDESSNRGQESAGEDNGFAIATEPAICQLQILTRDQHVASVLFNQGTAAV